LLRSSRPFSSTRPGHVPPPSSAAPTTTISNTSKTIDTDTTSKAVSEKTQAKTDWTIIKKLAVNIWPKNAFSTKVRVVGALGLLIGGKVLNVQVPFFFKDIVDGLNVPITGDTTVWVVAGAAIAGCE
jgi:ABC transporter ATM